jgi:hypothetical protein
MRRSEAEAAVTIGSDRDDDAAKNRAMREGEAHRVEVNGRRQYFKLQGAWSTAIICWISGLLLFNCALVSAVGLALVSFDNTPWLVTAFITEVFLQVIGLGYIAARFLFPGPQLRSPRNNQFGDGE